MKILASILIVLAIFRVISLSRRSDVAPEATKHNQVLGEMTARETASLIGGQGRVLLVSWQNPDRLIQVRENAFEKTAQKLGLTTAGIFRAEEREFHPLSGWSNSLYNRVADEYADVDAVVSFVYAPPMGVANGRTPQRLNGHFIVVLPNTETIEQYLAAGAVDLAVVPLPNPENLSSTKVDSGVWFNAYYRNLTVMDTERLQSEQQEDVPTDRTYSEEVDISDRLR
ncbi:MAG: hypothetical protein JJU29_17595 [Verrucomicrobia bacterium]|nr:hypothetical protein [Verrucomicrobiota bacterium]MCH8513756.1 hypothetical protein [Kiritimatiellia bacterium]